MSRPAYISWRRAWAHSAGHAATVCAVATAEPGGRPIAITLDWEHRMSTWDVTSGQPIGRPRYLARRRHAESTGPGNQRMLLDTGGDLKAAATATRDGRVLLITGSDDHLTVWDTATGEPTTGPPTSTRPLVTALSTVESDGRSLALAADRRGVRVWDLDTGVPVSHLPTADPSTVYAVATATIDGRGHVVTGARDATVRVWELSTGKPAGPPLTGHDGLVTAVATARVGGRPVAVTGSYGSHGTLRLWDLADPSPGGDVLASHDGWVGAVVATTAGGRPVVAVAYVNCPALHVHDLLSGRPSHVTTGLDQPVTALAATTQGHLVVGAGHDVVVLTPH